MVGAAIEFSFSRPVRAFGTWILEDFVEPSRFVLKITDTTGNIVYDNMMNAPDTSDPTTVLGGGNIEIHK